MTEDPTLPDVSGDAAGREFHPVADLFPLLRGAAFDELAADIKKNGLHEPILVDADGRILDGRNRYRACLKVGVEPRFVAWQGEGSLPELALSRNLRRRHLNESQRALVAARLAKLMEIQHLTRGKGRPRKNAANLRDFSRGDSRFQAATQVNVSPRLVTYAIKILHTGCAELITAVESGGLAVSTAALLAGLPEEEQKRVVEGGAQEAARKVRELRAAGRPAEPAASAPSPRPSPGCFGVVCAHATEPDRGAEAVQDGVVLLWVEVAALRDAIEALKARGLRYAPSQS